MKDSETADMNAMIALVEAIVGFLVDYPSAVSIHAKRLGDKVSLQVRVAPEDVGKLLGDKNRTALSLRVILLAASKKLEQGFTLEILE